MAVAIGRPPLPMGEDFLIGSLRREPTPEKSFMGYLKAIREGDQKTLEKSYGSYYVTKTAMGENSGVTGGYLVPVDYSTRLLGTIAEESFIFPRATVIPMTSSDTRCPRIDVETVPANATTSPFFGGIKFTWGFEQAPTETEPTFRENRLKAWDLIGYATISNQFLADIGPAGEDYLINLFGRAAAWSAEYAFLRGTGTAQQMPLGILNAPALLTVTRSATVEIAGTDVGLMASKLLPFGWMNGVWAMSPSVAARFFRNLTNYPPSQAHTYPPTKNMAGLLFGRPVFVTDKLPVLGTKGDILFFDPSLYTIGMRQEVLIDVSTHSSFVTNQTDFRIWLRCDGLPQVSNQITLEDGTTKVSPYVALSTL